MGVHENVADFATREALFQKLAQSKEVTRRLGHLLAVHLKVSAVHPRIYERLARRRLGLGNFVLVMREEVIDAARMKIESLAEIFHRHCRTLNMPTRTTAPPGRIPADRTVGIFPCFPERKIAYILLIVLIGRATLTCALIIKVDMGELTVTGKLPNIKVYASVVALVGDALFDETFN